MNRAHWTTKERVDQQLKELRKLLTKTHLQALLKGYKTVLKYAVRQKFPTTFDHHEGICNNVYNCNGKELEHIRFPHGEDGEELYAVIRLVRCLGFYWPRSKGYLVEDHCWPVPETPGCNRLWKGEQLELRIDLMRHIIKRLRDWERRAKD